MNDTVHRQQGASLKRATFMSVVVRTSSRAYKIAFSPSMKIPLLDLNLQYKPFREELLSAIVRVCDSQRFILGPEVEALESEVSTLIGIEHAVGVSSGTDALVAALMALGVGPGDEVVTSTFSFFATAGAIARVGARPVFVDIDAKTFNLDLGAAAAAVGRRTRAIIPVHLFGQTEDLQELVESLPKGRVDIIEDAAQAIGARFKDRFAGTTGTLGCFSFFPSKNLGAFGDAGLVVASGADRADQVRRLRVHGARPKYHHAIVGGNFRIDALQAAVLRVKLPHLSTWTSERRANAARYRILFADAGLGGDIGLPYESPDAFHIYNQFVIRTARRDELRARLTSRGIGTEVYYPIPLHLQECFASLGYRRGEFPNAERAALETLALPIYPGLSEAQQAYVVNSIAELFE